MAAPCVQFVYHSRGRLIIIQEFFGSLVQCIGNDFGLFVVVLFPKEYQRYRKCQEFTQRIPPQVAFFEELFHVLGGRATCSGLEPSTTVNKRYEGRHLRNG